MHIYILPEGDKGRADIQRLEEVEKRQKEREREENEWAMCTHPAVGGVGTYPVSAQVVDYAREGGVSTLRDGHVLQWIDEVRLIA